MRDNVKAFLETVARVIDVPEPVVEIGSLQTPGQEGFADLRALFPGKRYVGCDIVAGPGVDRIEDVSSLRFDDASVGTFLLADSLEHVAEPWRAAAGMARALRQDGLLVVAAPFVFPVHHHPDYHRFTPEGLAHLLAPLPHVAVLSEGDAQWPHTVYGIAGHTDVRARAERVAVEWRTSPFRDPLLPFVPVRSVFRHDAAAAKRRPLVPGAPLVETFVCPAPGLCRVDVRLVTAGTPGPIAVELVLADDDATATVRARVTTPGGWLWSERWLPFPFAPLADSTGRRYRLTLAAADGAPGRGLEAPLLADGSACFDAFARRDPA